MIRVGLLGARGRMGQRVTHLLAADSGEYASRCRLAATADRGDPLLSLLETDAVIDFSSPGASRELAALALQKKTGLPVFVVGSTGWKPEQLRAVESLAGVTPVLISSNFSTGVLALQKILKDHSATLAELGYSPVMVEAHHVHKKDAPSGTALMLNRAIEEGSGVGPVQTHSIRSGEVIGDHEVAFYGPADRLVFGHFAQDRSIFARGALEAALWMAGRRDELIRLGAPLTMDRYFEERYCRARGTAVSSKKP